MYTIAVIEDDVHIGEILEKALGREGYKVLRAYSGTEALYLLERETPDLVLLDLMLPGLSGEEVLPKIKGIPVIVVSAKVGVDDKVDLLLGGAADYVTKPFELRELLARVKVQLRKVGTVGANGIGGVYGTVGANGIGGACGKAGTNDIANAGGMTGLNGIEGMYGCAERLQVGDLALDLYSNEACVKGENVKLTRTEHAILKLLMQNPNQAMAKSLILDRISLDTPDCTESSLKQHVSNLRKKLREAGERRTVNGQFGDGGDEGYRNDEEGREYIESVWGIGFKLNV